MGRAALAAQPAAADGPGMAGRAGMAGGVTAAVTIDRMFDAVVLDWDGCGGSQQRQRAAVRRRVEALCRAGVDVAVLGRASLAHLDAHLGARPGGPGRLLLCAGNGAE